jgi:hypothetical protein
VGANANWRRGHRVVELQSAGGAVAEVPDWGGATHRAELIDFVPRFQLLNLSRGLSRGGPSVHRSQKAVIAASARSVWTECPLPSHSDSTVLALRGAQPRHQLIHSLNHDGWRSVFESLRARHPDPFLNPGKEAWRHDLLIVLTPGRWYRWTRRCGLVWPEARANAVDARATGLIVPSVDRLPLASRDRATSPRTSARPGGDARA